ncbi:MAG: ABC transporter permease [Thermoleophilaceae bacterium]
MRKVTLKGLAMHKTRAILTTLAVVIGVAMISGAYVVSDTMLSAAKSLSGSAYDNTDAVVTAKSAFTNTDDVGSAVTIAPGVLSTVRQNPNVAMATGDITEQAKLIDKKGKVVGSGPYFAVGLDPVSGKNLTPFRLQSGRYATGANEIAIDQASAKKQHWQIGDMVKVSAIGPAKSYKVVGVLRFGSVESLGTATMAVFTLPEAQKIFRKGANYNSILVGAREGVSQAKLQSSLRQQLGPQMKVQSAKKQDRFTLDGLTAFVKIIRGILVAFGAISIFVGAFIIFNTLSITVAQRIRELAMLRTVGASRRQVMRSVVGEAFAMGVAGTVVGIGFGFGIAKALQAVMSAAGLDLPKVGTVFEARTAIVAAIVGIGVTVLASIAPALRATRIEPVAALREGAELPLTKTGKRLPKIAFGVTVVGVVGTVVGNFGSGMSFSERLPFIGIGSFLLFIGIAMLSPKFVKPLASVLGRPGEKFGGAAGVLARRNAERKPGRTAGTAAAMMIGIALVTFVAVLAAAVKTTAEGAMRTNLSSTDYVISAQDNWSPVTQEAKDTAKSVPGVSVVQGVREDTIKVGKSKIRIDGVNGGQLAQVFHYKWKQGSDATLSQLDGSGAVVLSDYAKTHHLKIGSPITVTAQSGKTVGLKVMGITDSTTNGLDLAELTISNGTFGKYFHADGDRFALIKGGSLPELKAALAAYPAAKVSTKDKYIHNSLSWMNSMLAILYVMLAFAVLVSLFGIVNTLALSVVERTREIGMLRAVGMTRPQTRRMVRHESIVTALIGAALGAGVGLFLGGMTVGALHSLGLKFTLPVGTLLAFVVLAVVAGTLAAIMPARRAARLNVLEALQYV